MDKTQKGKQQYDQMVKEASPNSKLFINCVKAFIIGGIICVIGQLILNFTKGQGLSEDDAALVTSVLLILASAVLTGFGLYGKLGKFAGAGSVVPITGFANSVVSPAIEFKKEGWIFGLGAKMFIIAGPVIVYGTLASFIVGILYYFFG